jgi:hypothetical protein
VLINVLLIRAPSATRANSASAASSSVIASLATSGLLTPSATCGSSASILRFSSPRLCADAIVMHAAIIAITIAQVSAKRRTTVTRCIDFQPGPLNSVPPGAVFQKTP